MYKLNQVVAIEKSIKSKTCSEISKLHNTNQKAELFVGFSKNYTAKDEEGETYPQEEKRVQLIAREKIDEFASSLTELLNITACKDKANCKAIANVVVDGQVIIENASTPYLLFLEKQIADIKTYIEKLPELDTSEDWKEDLNSGLYKTEPVQTHKTKKEHEAIVLYPATDKHPAQTQLIVRDNLVGYWNIIKYSGAIPKPEKKKYLDRIDKLIYAVKFAREKANSVDAENVEVGKNIFNYLLK